MVRKKVTCWCGKSFYFYLPVVDFKYENKKYTIKRATPTGDNVYYTKVDKIVCCTRCATKARLEGYTVANYELMRKRLN